MLNPLALKVRANKKDRVSYDLALEKEPL